MIQLLKSQFKYESQKEIPQTSENMNRNLSRKKNVDFRKHVFLIVIRA